MELSTKSMGWHVGSLAAGAVAGVSYAASGQVDLYALYNEFQTWWAQTLKILAILSPALAVMGAAYRTYGSKQVPATATAVQLPASVEPPAPGEHVTIATVPASGVGGIQAAAKVVGMLLFAILCLSVWSPAYAQQSSIQQTLAPLFTKLAADAQAAYTDAKQHNDDIAANCWQAINVVATAKAVESTPGGGALLVFQKVRDITRLNSSPQGTQLIIGCAPLVQDSKLNMLQFFTNIGGSVLVKGLLVP